MPQSTDPSRDLLFGLLALQNGLIDQGALFSAFAAWTRDKARSLADHLVELGHLDAPRRAAVEAIAGVHVQALGGDVEKSLAAVPTNRSARARLAALGEPEIEATLARVARSKNGPSTHAEDDDPDRTASIAVGSATTGGQRFRILRPHARGGLGAVFVAMDNELHREVALKQILDHHADDPDSRQRFVAEAEITGGLEHPGVVPVYGLGMDADGHPYYAMRFIKGDSLREAIDQFHKDVALNNEPGRRSLELRKLLRRFTDVCNAIDYAHSRGVIHRDLKPANIIMGKHGETLVVDWGLAKAVGRADSSAGEQTLAPSSSGSSETLPGSALGTPAYMSPEQARGELNRLGPRSDVYSLGATLYCLLTGTPPFEGDDIGVVLRAVQEGRFQRPSHHHSALDKALEAVCLKAMAKEPLDRYPTSKALADDLERWMADEPVTAWREPFSRRARRWARRNRTAVTAAAVALVAGVVGLSAVLAVQTRAKAELAASLKRERTAKTVLAKTNADLTHSQAAVQTRYDLAVDAIKTFHTGVIEDFLLKQEEFKEVRDRLLNSASEFYGKLGALLGNESDLGSRRALWQTNYEVAELTGKVGKSQDALAAHRQVLAAREALLAESPADPNIKADVARSLAAVADLLENTGQTKEAEATYRKAETLLTELAPTIAEAATVRAVLASCRSRVGWLLHTMGREDEALSVLRLARAEQEALAAAPGATAESQRDLAETINNLARLLMPMGKTTEAEAEYRKALTLYQKLADDNPTVTDFRSKLARSHNNVGAILWATGRSSAAETEIRKALAIHQKLADDNPAVSDFRNRLANHHDHLGLLLSNSGQSSAAEAEYRKALAIHQKLADDNPAMTDFRSRLAMNHYGLGLLLSNTGNPSEAEAEYRKSLALYQRLADDNPAVVAFRTSLAFAHYSIGLLRSNAGKSSEAEAEYDKAVAINQKLADDNPTMRTLQMPLALSLDNIGCRLAQAGKTSEAIGYFIREQAIWQALSQASSATLADRDYLANCQTNMADALRRARRLDEALVSCQRSLEVREPLVEAHPDVPGYREGLGETYLRLGQVHCDMEKLAAASTAWKRALTHFDGYKSPRADYTFIRACCHAGLAGLAGRPGSGVSTAERADQAEKAMGLLRQAVAMGYRSLDAYQTESALDPIRDRADFRALMMDLVMPTKPFAR